MTLMQQNFKPLQRNGVLTEIGPDQSEIRLEAAEIAAYSELIGARLDANQSDGHPLVVACFMSSWEAIAAAQAALSRGLSFQPWQFSMRRIYGQELTLRCEKLRGMAIKPVLLINPKLMETLDPANLEIFQSVIEIGLANASFDPATGARTSAKPLKPEARVLVETAGVSDNSKTVALPLLELQYRANLAQQSTDDGVSLEVAPFDSAEGIERILGLGRDTVVINADLAAEDPLKILGLVGRHGVTDLHLTPGYVSRLLHLLDQDRPVPDLRSIRTVIVGGAKIMLQDVVRLSEYFEAAGAPDLHVQFDYRTAECGLIASTGRIPAHALSETVRQGNHVSLGHGVGDTVLQVVDRDFEPLRENEIGQIQVRCAHGAATHYIESAGRQIRSGLTTGWVATGDLGFLNSSGLTITSRMNARIIVPRRIFELSDIESKLRHIGGLHPELLAVVLLPPRQHSDLQRLAVCFSSIENTEAEVKRISTELFATVVSMTGLQPEVYHCRPEKFPVTASLTIKRARLRHLIRTGFLKAFAEPILAFEQPDLLSLAELQQWVAQVWQSTLQLDFLPRHDDDIFALGADSLALTTMFTEVESVFKQKIDIEIFFGNPTIEGLCLSMQDFASEIPVIQIATQAVGSVRKIEEFSAIWRGQKAFPDSMLRGMNTDGSKPPLFWVTQGEQAFLRLAKTLGPDQPIYGMRSAVGVIEHYSHDSVDEITNRYLWEILGLLQGREYYLGGNCQAAIIALSLAKRLQQIGQPALRLIMMEWFFDLGGYDGSTVFLTGEDSFVAERQRTEPSLQKLDELFPNSTFRSIDGAHRQFFKDRNIDCTADEIRRAMSEGG